MAKELSYKLSSLSLFSFSKGSAKATECPNLVILTFKLPSLTPLTKITKPSFFAIPSPFLSYLHF